MTRKADILAKATAGLADAAIAARLGISPAARSAPCSPACEPQGRQFLRTPLVGTVITDDGLDEVPHDAGAPRR